jgi:hypothetical protein
MLFTRPMIFKLSSPSGVHPQPLGPHKAICNRGTMFSRANECQARGCKFDSRLLHPSDLHLWGVWLPGEGFQNGYTNESPFISSLFSLIAESSQPRIRYKRTVTIYVLFTYVLEAAGMRAFRIGPGLLHRNRKAWL